MSVSREIERIRTKLWDVLDRLEDEELDEEEAEARVGVLDSLVELLRVERMSKERTGDARQQSAGAERRS